MATKPAATCFYLADTLLDTLVRGHAQCPADGIAVLMPGLKTTRPSTDTRELTGDELKNRADHRPSWFE